MVNKQPVEMVDEARFLGIDQQTSTVVTVRGDSPVRLFCVDCERRAEILWHEPDHANRATTLHVRCHGQEYIVRTGEYIVRRESSIKGSHVDILLSECHFYSDEDIAANLLNQESIMLAAAERMRVYQQVLKSRQPQGGAK